MKASTSSAAKIPMKSHPNRSTAAKAKSLRQNNLVTLQEILEHVRCHIDYAGPLETSAIVILRDAAASFASYALKFDYPKCHKYSDGYFSVRLDALDKCIQTSKSGKALNLPPKEARRMVSIYAAHLFDEIRAWAEAITDETMGKLSLLGA